MSRRGGTKKNLISPDPLYGNKLVSRFINRVMRQGKKGVAQSLVYKAFEKIKEKNLDALTVFQGAVQNVSPRMEVKSRRVGGASYQVPMEIGGDKRVSLALRWLIWAAKKRPNKEYHSFDLKLAAELLDAYHSTGEAIKKRDLVHRMAEANKAFAHFRW